MAVRVPRRDPEQQREESHMNGSIICGVDGSPHAQAAVKVGKDLAEALGSTLILANVAAHSHVGSASAFPFGGTFGQIVVAERVEADERAALELLDRVALATAVPDAERRVVFGDPAEALAELADEENGELIVVGSRGRGAVKAAFLGSVSNSLVGVARCPVLVVPCGAVEALSRTPATQPKEAA
jgi:nucleotide-binding universal stress UspA family protein